MMECDSPERRAETDRLVKVGQLAAGHAHDFANLLGPLTWTLEKISRTSRVMENPTLRRDVQEARDIADRACATTRCLLSLARHRPLVRPGVDINRVVADACRLAEPRLCDQARLVVEARAVPCIPADEAALVHAVLNLLLNAAQAFEHPGEAANEVCVRLRPEGGQVCIEVHDNGRGIPLEIQRRVFEPFYTTRAPSEGTGLGLAVCRDVARAHGGTIELFSEPGAGTTFLFCLPAAGAPTSM